MRTQKLWRHQPFASGADSALQRQQNTREGKITAVSNLAAASSSIYRGVPTSAVSLTLTEISASKQLTVKTPHVFLTSQHYTVSESTPVDSELSVSSHTHIHKEQFALNTCQLTRACSLKDIQQNDETAHRKHSDGHPGMAYFILQTLSITKACGITWAILHYRLHLQTTVVETSLAY